MKSVVGTLKIDLAQFRELEAFATFGSELDKASQAQLDRGYRLTELLKQGLNVPLPVQEQVVVIYAGVRGHIDDVAVEDVQRFEAELRAYMRARHAGLLDQIVSTGALPDEGDLEAAIVEFKRGFAPADVSSVLGAGDEGGPHATGAGAAAGAPEATASVVREPEAE